MQDAVTVVEWMQQKQRREEMDGWMDTSDTLRWKNAVLVIWLMCCSKERLQVRMIQRF